MVLRFQMPKAAYGGNFLSDVTSHHLVIFVLIKINDLAKRHNTCLGCAII